jgi:two-component system sensor histidine kinase UhpB
VESSSDNLNQGNGRFCLRGNSVKRKQAPIPKLDFSEKFEAFVDQLGGILYVIALDEYGSLLYISSTVNNVLGFTPAQWCLNEQLRKNQIHSKDRQAVMTAINTAILNKQGYCIDYRIHARDGTLHWFHDEAQIVTDSNGMPLFLQGVILDITERKHAQFSFEKSRNELQQKIASLDSIRETEKMRLAQEMHDDLGQLLTAMKVDISVLSQQLPKDDEEIWQQLNVINQTVEAMIASVKRIVADLPPKRIEDLGLTTALEALISDVQKRHAIQLHLCVGRSIPVLSSKIEISIYRIVQEALNNVCKHASASHVNIQLEVKGDRLTLCIRDNGIGMLKTSELQKRGSFFGLISMKERISALGGMIKIYNANGGGTAIEITIPLEST